MFNLSRYFSTVSFILVVLAAGVLGPLYQKLSLQQMQALAESRNVAMAQVFQNALQSALASVISDSVGRDASELRASEDLARLRQEALALMKGTAIVKIKVYNRIGSTIFSTDPAQIGESKLDNSGFRAASKGVVVSELTHRDRIDTFEGTKSDVDVLASYIPIVGKDQSIDGVFELYQNVTPFVAQLQRSLWWRRLPWRWFLRCST